MTKQRYLGIEINVEDPPYITEFSKTLLDGFYKRDDETISQALARPAAAFCYGDYELAQRIYDYVYNGWFMYASPVLSNATKGNWVEAKGSHPTRTRTFSQKLAFVPEEKNYGLPISCFAFNVPDTAMGQVEIMPEMATLSLVGGGTGAHLSIRAVDSKAPGPIPYMKVMDSLIGYFRQGKTRKGAVAMYMDVNHPDIKEHIRFRKPGGDTKRRSDNRKQVHCAVNLTDEFINAVLNNLDFDLKCPHSGKVYETIKARSLWEEILETRAVTGEPYLLKIDAANRKLPETQKAKGLKIRGSNLCVAPETKILTKEGYQPIQALENTQVDVWNGAQWSGVTVVKTGTNQRLLKVATKDGYELECTPYHKFYKSVRTSVGNKVEEVRAEDLKPGDKLIKFNLPIIEGEATLDFAYANGFYTGDGCEVRGKQRLYFYGEKRQLVKHCGEIFEGYWACQEDQDREYGHTTKLRDKYFVPSCNYTINSRLDWLAGLFDADGTVTKNGKTQSYQVASVEKDFLKEVQLMLQTLGVQSKVTKNRDSGYRTMPSNDGAGGSSEYFCKTIYRLLIGNDGLSKLSDLGLVTHRLKVTAHRPNRECSHFVKIESITDTGRVDDTYCFTEPLSGKGMFNGILTGQCSEIVLPTDENRTFVCCLSSLNLEKWEEWKDTAIVEDLIRFLDNVLQYFVENAPPALAKAAYSAKMERALGLGTLGWQGFLQSKSIPFEGGGFNSAIQWTHKIYGTIKERAVAESRKLAVERGEPDDMIGTGLRNSRLMAIAPNANSADLLDTSPSIEMYFRNIFIKSTRAGNFKVYNRHLKKRLQELRQDTDEVWDSIDKNEGSVSHLEFLTEHEKKVFATFAETDMHWVIEQAQQRGQATGEAMQAQSLNVFFPYGSSKQYVNSVHLKFLKSDDVLTMYYYRTEREMKTDNVKAIERRALVDWSGDECVSCSG